MFRVLSPEEAGTTVEPQCKMVERLLEAIELDLAALKEFTCFVIEPDELPPWMISITGIDYSQIARCQLAGTFQ